MAVGTRGPTATESSSASMGSDLPRVRANLRAWFINFGATRTTFCPADSRSRSSRADKLRESSIPHSTSPPNSVRAQTSALACPAVVAATTFSPSLRPTSSTATKVWVRLCTSVPTTTMVVASFTRRGDHGWAGRRTHLSRGEATPLSSQAGRSFPPDAGTTVERQPEGGSVCKSQTPGEKEPNHRKAGPSSLTLSVCRVSPQ